MAINKKLKKFDDNGTYRNFLTTSDFERPDVSSIGAGSVPQNLDVEYNPTRMLFLNAKYRLFPTSTKIEFVIDTITNGTVGCWYKPSTGSTYTKLNNTDLTFYSAYTQNRVTNLTFDTVGISSLSDECNIIYELRASSTTDASMTASDTCVQRGLISLTGEDFSSSGGSLNYELKTAPENPWKITNTNSWLTFSTLTGVGPTTIVITATQWTDTTQGRTGNVTLEYTDMEYSTQISIKQNKVDNFFYVGNTLPEATTNACTYASIVGSADTSEKYVYYKTVGYDVSSLSLYKDDMFASASFESGDRIRFNLNINPNPNDRTGIILIRDNSTIIAQITVSQQAKRIDYLYVGNTLAEATTSACTYASTVSSAAGSYSIYYKTNYTSTEIGSLTFQNDSMFESVSFATTTTAGTINVSVKENSLGSPSRSGNIWIKSGSTNVVKITFNQAKGEDKYFYWDDGSTSATTKEVNVLSGDSYVICQYVTSYNSLTTATTSTWITSATLIDGTLTVNFSPNPDTSIRIGTMFIKYGEDTVGTLTITQAKKIFFLWSNNTSAITQTIAATTTIASATYTTNYTGLIVESAESYTWVTDKGITNPSGNGTFSATTQQNSSVRTRTSEFLFKTGSTTVGKLTLEQAGVDYENEYLTFVALEDGAFRFSGSTTTNTLSYSLDDGSTWVLLPHDTNTPVVQSGNTIMWKGTCTPYAETNRYGIGYFISNSKFNVEGNIMSLLYGDNFVGQISLGNTEDTFGGLFTRNSQLMSAENMKLPATVLVYGCYGFMFEDCTSLTKVPTLPNITVFRKLCCNGMFKGCTSLVSFSTTSIGNSASTLYVECFNGMFSGCTAMTTAPELPATTLAEGCYLWMFEGCSSLTTAPELPATRAAVNCYRAMFDGCTSLTVAPDLPATTLATSCYQDMFSGCTAMTTVPSILPATTLETDCYTNMFRSCTSITRAPELPAATLVNGCYWEMFRGCTNLNYIKCLATNIYAYNCTSDWVNGVAPTGTFVKNPNMRGWTTGVNGIPSGWVVEDAI